MAQQTFSPKMRLFKQRTWQLWCRLVSLALETEGHTGETVESAVKYQREREQFSCLNVLPSRQKIHRHVQNICVISPKDTASWSNVQVELLSGFRGKPASRFLPKKAFDFPQGDESWSCCWDKSGVLAYCFGKHRMSNIKCPALGTKDQLWCKLLLQYTFFLCGKYHASLS